MSNLIKLFQALRYGSELSNAEAWKNRGTAIAALTGLLSILAGIAASRGWLRDLDPDTITGIASGIVTLVSTLLAYLQVATSARVGVGQQAATEVPPKENFLGAEATISPQPSAPDPVLPVAPVRLRHPARDPGPAHVPSRPAPAAQSGDRQDDNPFLFS